MIQTIKEMIRLNIKPNFAALGREYECDYRTAKIRYYEELNKEKGIEPIIKTRKHIVDDYKGTVSIIHENYNDRNAIMEKLLYYNVDSHSDDLFNLID